MIAPNPKRDLLITSACLALVVWSANGMVGIPPIVPVIERTEVSEEVATAIAPVAKALKKAPPEECKQLSAFWTAISADIAADNSPIKTVADIRSLQAAAGPVFVKGTVIGGKDLVAACEKAADSLLGKDPASLTDETRATAGELYTAMAQAAADAAGG